MVNKKENLIIIHLSDLHFGMFNRFKNQPYNLEHCWDLVIKKLNEILEGEYADILVISGDLGSCGKWDHDLEDAKKFLEDHFDYYIKNKKIVIIPGNHDLEWTEGKANKKNPDRFKNYYRLLKEITGIDKTSLDKRNIPIYFEEPHYIFGVKVNKMNFNTAFISLNSCFFTAYENDKPNSIFKENLSKKATLNKNLLLKYLKEAKENYPIEKYPIRIALLHHNVDLNDYTGIRRLGTNTLHYDKLINKLRYEDFLFEIILHGHRHIKQIRKEDDSIIIAAGSLFIKDSELINLPKLRKFLENNYQKILDEDLENVDLSQLPVKRPNNLNIIEISWDYYNSTQDPVLKVSVETLDIDYEEDEIQHSKIGFMYLGLSNVKFNELKTKTQRHTEIANINPEIVMREIQDVDYIIKRSKLRNLEKRRNDLQSFYKILLESSLLNINIAQEIFDEIINNFKRNWKPGKYRMAKDNLVRSLDLLPKESISKIKIKNPHRIILEKLPHVQKMALSEEVTQKVRYIRNESLKFFGEAQITLKTPTRASSGGYGGVVGNYVSWSPIRRLMKHNGAIMVAHEAVEELIDWMSASAVAITKSALVLAKHGKRKKITQEDLKLAIKYF